MAGGHTNGERRRSHDTLVGKLHQLSGSPDGSCTCRNQGGVDDWKFHHVDCRWRLIMQAASRITDLECRPA